MISESKKLSSFLFVSLLGAGLHAVHAAPPVINVRWDGGGSPEQGTDYILSSAAPASPDFPNIELITGRLDWRIWSTDTDNPEGIGDIGVISSFTKLRGQNPEPSVQLGRAQRQGHSLGPD